MGNICGCCKKRETLGINDYISFEESSNSSEKDGMSVKEDYDKFLHEKDMKFEV